MAGRFSVVMPIFVVAVLASAPASTPTRADDEFPIAGLYTKDETCAGTAAQRADLRVRITARMIESQMGVCTILNHNRNGNTFALHVECKVPVDQIILGDVTLKIRDQNSLAFDDQDHTSPAILYRCPTK